MITGVQLEETRSHRRIQETFPWAIGTEKNPRRIGAACEPTTADDKRGEQDCTIKVQVRVENMCSFSGFRMT